MQNEHFGEFLLVSYVSIGLITSIYSMIDEIINFRRKKFSLFVMIVSCIMYVCCVEYYYMDIEITSRRIGYLYPKRVNIHTFIL